MPTNTAKKRSFTDLSESPSDPADLSSFERRFLDKIRTSKIAAVRMECYSLFGPQYEEWVGSVDGDNTERRRQRSDHYVDHLKGVFSMNDINLYPDTRVADIGCGDGEISMGVFGEHIRSGGTVEACDVADYLSDNARSNLDFKKGDLFDVLRDVPDNHYDIVMENVMLHHLPTLDHYRKALHEIMRVTAPGGISVITETVHQNFRELTQNAYLDRIMNDKTNRQNGPSDSIPVSLQFMSRAQLLGALCALGGKIIDTADMQPHSADPKIHTTFCVTKPNRLQHPKIIRPTFPDGRIGIPYSLGLEAQY